MAMRTVMTQMETPTLLMKKKMMMKKKKEQT